MRRTLLLTVAALCLVPPLAAQPAAATVERRPILLDTDLGCDLDDALALALLLGSPEADLRGVTAAGSPGAERGLMLCRFLTMTGRRSIPVAVGAEPQPGRPITRQRPYHYHPDPLFGRTTKPDPRSAAEFLLARLKESPGRTTLLAAGPLTNVARLLQDAPEARALLKDVVAVEEHFALDLPAARAVLASGVGLRVVPARWTAGRTLDAATLQRVFAPGTPLSRQTQALYQMEDRADAPLADVLAAAACLGGGDRPRFTWTEQLVALDDQGRLRGVPAGEKGARAEVLSELPLDALVRWYGGRMAALLPPERNPVPLVARGGRPARVHVAEDFDTDVERRWWMSGKPETRDLPAAPPASRRACRGVLTHDFDDLLMPSRRMETAVIFNPVPGPMMGPHTRLAFRCKLHGTSSLRVQIYSLSNGYHRQLVVTGLPQDEWREAAVDLTRARRADGTGGPLAAGERIDDIQFYADADAGLLIDDVVLYDAAPASEVRPFPRRILFTAGFDTGRAGTEWPGEFTLVPDPAGPGRAAQGVQSRDRQDGQEKPCVRVRVSLKGDRPADGRTRVAFRARVGGADALRVRLVHTGRGTRHEHSVAGFKPSAWTDAEVEFPAVAGPVDEVHVLGPPGAEILVDDVLLYEPAP